VNKIKRRGNSLTGIETREAAPTPKQAGQRVPPNEETESSAHVQTASRDGMELVRWAQSVVVSGTFYFLKITPFPLSTEKNGKLAKHTGPGSPHGKGHFLAGFCSQHSTCPEAVGLVYKFFPNGSLEDLLACKNNTHGRHALKLLERFVQLSFSFLAVLASHMISNPILLGL